jgi:capsular polysaccharide biosynthesis protein
MIQEPLDFKRALQLVRRHKIIVLAAVVLGLVAGGAYAVLRPPMLTSQAWVVLPPATGENAGTQVVGTQVVIAHSDPVLTSALEHVNHGHPGVSLQALRDNVDVKARAGAIIAITAKDKSASQAEDIANAIAQSYVDYVGHRGNLPDGPVQAQVFQRATTASGTKSSSRLVGIGLLGALLGAVIAALGILAVSRRDRRLRERDEIADSIGVPVLASMSVDHRSDAAGWRKLLEEYQPGAVDAWRMRKALQYLGLTDLGPNGHKGTGFTLAVISSSDDRRALALGPQLAVFAASRGIPAALVIGPQQDVSATATLRAACAAPHEPSNNLQVMVRDHADAIGQPDVALTVIVSVVDDQAPQVASAMGTTAAVLGVSAGVATAEQLARIAASAAVSGHDIVGILVADPDPGDITTGRLPQVKRPAQRRRPTRMTGTTMETRE